MSFDSPYATARPLEKKKAGMTESLQLGEKDKCDESIDLPQHPKLKWKSTLKKDFSRNSSSQKKSVRFSNHSEFFPIPALEYESDDLY